MLTNDYLTEDLSSGYALRVVGSAVIDGIAGWAVVALADGTTLAYAPQNYMLNYGEIAREI